MDSNGVSSNPLGSSSHNSQLGAGTQPTDFPVAEHDDPRRAEEHDDLRRAGEHDGVRSETLFGQPATDFNAALGGWLPILLAVLGGLFYWLSLPPMKFPWAGFVASFFFSALVMYPHPLGRRRYWAIYGVGCLLWLGLLQGIRLAYWPLYGGWIALSLYVAVYLPLFVGTARILRLTYQLPAPVACAVSWTGWELVRSYFATGFSACMLGHSLTPWPSMLDIASHLGMFGVGFFIMLTGATACYFATVYFVELPRNTSTQKWRYSEPLSAVASLVLVCSWVIFSQLSYKVYNDYLSSMQPIKPLGRFLIVQGNMPTMFESNVDSLVASWSEYARQTRNGVEQVPHHDVDVVLWPESTFDSGRPLPWSHFDWDQRSKLIPEWGIEGEELKMMADENMAYKWSRLTPTSYLPVSYLVGGAVLSLHDNQLKRYNAALWITPNSSRPALPDIDYYGKRHLVMFGEYIPVISWFPKLLEQFGMGTLDAGERYVGWQTRSGCTVAPSVCFENVVPQLIRQQVKELVKQGNAPDLLINVTNDAWFRGSSLLDHHLNNAIGCAVENRKPMLVAANNGISAWIDGSGAIVNSLDRLTEGTLIAEPIPDSRWGLWQEIGDWPAKIAAFVTLAPWVGMILISIFWRIKRR